MTHTRRAVATVAALLLVGATMVACDEQVTGRKCRGDNETGCQIRLKDSEGNTRWISADDLTWRNCQIGDQYPACSSTGYDNQEARDARRNEQDKRRSGQGPDVDPAPNPPVRNEREANRNHQSREVCIQASMGPRRRVRVDWSLNFSEATDGVYGQFGPRCRRVQPGTLVWINVKEDNFRQSDAVKRGRRATLCEVFTASRGPIGRVIIDAVMVADGRDCHARGRVPATG